MTPASVLIVEDDPTTRYLMAQVLGAMGHAVVSAADGDEGLRYLYSEEPCDVVISDVIMPVMSGVEFASRVRAARPGVPVLLITGKSDGLDAATAAGAFVLSKPVSRPTLISVLTEALEYRPRR